MTGNLHEAMRELVSDQPPMRHGPTDDLRRGRRSLALRRSAVGVVGATILAVSAAAWLGEATQDPSQAPGVTAEPSSEIGAADVLEKCEGLGSNALDHHWETGNRILTWASASRNVRAVLVSGDGQRWADCWLRTGSTGPGWFATYPMTGARQPVGIERANGDTGPQAGVYSFLERFPEDVASVELTFGNGDRRKVDAVEGFVVAQFDDLDPSTALTALRMHDATGKLVAGPENAPGDGSLPPEYRTLVPATPLAFVGHHDGW